VNSTAAATAGHGPAASLRSPRWGCDDADVVREPGAGDVPAAGDVAVVFVPGLGLGPESSQPTRRFLDRPCSVITLPGFGQPAPAAQDLCPAALATMLLDRLGSQRAVLVGHSSSCQIVAEAAAAAPERVVGVALVGPTTDPAMRTWARMAVRWLATAVHERPSMVPSLLRQYARTGLLSMYRAMDAARRHDIEAALGRAPARQVVLRGRHDRIAPPHWVERLARAGGGQAVTLPGGGHMIVITHGRQVATAVARLSLPGPHR